MDAPRFRTAIPLRRYRLGEYLATVLGDIDSSDGREYTYILAMVMEGSRNPRLYVTLEPNRGEAKRKGSHRMRVIGERLNEDLGSNDKWRDVLQFSASALSVAMHLLGLKDEQPLPVDE